MIKEIIEKKEVHKLVPTIVDKIVYVCSDGSKFDKIEYAKDHEAFLSYRIKGSNFCDASCGDSCEGWFVVNSDEDAAFLSKSFQTKIEYNGERKVILVFKNYSNNSSDWWDVYERDEIRKILEDLLKEIPE